MAGTLSVSNMDLGGGTGRDGRQWGWRWEASFVRVPRVALGTHTTDSSVPTAQLRRRCHYHLHQAISMNRSWTSGRERCSMASIPRACRVTAVWAVGWRLWIQSCTAGALINDVGGTSGQFRLSCGMKSCQLSILTSQVSGLLRIQPQCVPSNQH